MVKCVLSSLSIFVNYPIKKDKKKQTKKMNYSCGKFLNENKMKLFCEIICQKKKENTRNIFKKKERKNYIADYYFIRCAVFYIISVLLRQ